MRILMVHNSYLAPGGEDESTEAEELLLRSHGHEVDSFRESNRTIERNGALRTAARAIWSSSSYQRVQASLKQKKYDVMHVQNFFPLLSPSIYYAAKKEGVSVVQTLRNYRLLCPKANLFRDGKSCEDCVGKTIAWPSITHACYRGSRAGTVAVAAMLATHHFLRTWSREVDVFIALTEFSRRKFLEGGLPERKLIVKPNFVYPDVCAGGGAGKYFIFVGRLAPEKGIVTLLKAWELVSKNVVLKVVGDGPLEAQVKEAASRLHNVQWLGRRRKEEVYSLVSDAACLVFPSEWYEGMPRTIIESLAVGTPILAANIGAMNEMIRHNETGVLFKAGDSRELYLAARSLSEDTYLIRAMRRHARSDFEAKYTAERNLPLLLNVYEQAVRTARNACPN